ncbi:MAG: hypothetical protein Q8K75_07260 [Chlamydiales bacterium]|nr:hypothetical protein [Chlamydiales bacterium]
MISVDNFSKVQLVPASQLQGQQERENFPVSQPVSRLQITLGDFMSNGVRPTRRKKKGKITPVVVPVQQTPITRSNSLGNLPSFPQEGGQRTLPHSNSENDLSDHLLERPALPFASQMFIDNGFPSEFDQLDAFNFDEGVDLFATSQMTVFDGGADDIYDLEAGLTGNNEDMPVAGSRRDAIVSGLKSGATTIATYLAPLGAVAGVFAGIFQRVVNEIPPDMINKAACRASQTGILGSVNQVMQTMIKGGTKYVPPLLPIAIICGTILYRTGKGADNCSIGSVWKSFKEEVQKAPVREMAMAVSLVALAVISAVTEGSWAGTIPYIFDSSDPSGHVMMQIVLGLALVQAARAANLYGNKTLAALTYAYGGISAVANAIFLSHTAYACHTIQEIQEGFKWAGAVLMGSRLTVGASNAVINTRLATKQFKKEFAKKFV